jgi:hypothetical protein
MPGISAIAESFVAPLAFDRMAMLSGTVPSDALSPQAIRTRAVANDIADRRM